MAFNYNINPIDIGAYFRGLDSAERRKAMEMQNQQTEQQAGLINTLGQSQTPMLEPEFQQLKASDPARAMQIMQIAGVEDEMRMNAMLTDAKRAQNMIRSGDTQGAMGLLGERAQLISQMGGNPRDTMEPYNKLRSGDAEGALRDLTDFTSLFDASAGKPREFARQAAAPKVDPETGQIYQIEYDPNTGTSRRINVPGAIAQTPEELASGEVSKETQKRLYSQAVDASKSAFEQLPNVRKSISNIDSAISELEKGANTGPVMSMLPSVTEASIALDNIAGQMGLDVIGSTTFGALSEAELKFALDTALPRGLERDALKSWLKRKKEAQRKLAKELRSAAIYLGKGNKTIADYLESKGPDYIQMGAQPNQAGEEDSRSEQDILSQYGL